MLEPTPAVSSAYSRPSQTQRAQKGLLLRRRAVLLGARASWSAVHPSCCECMVGRRLGLRVGRASDLVGPGTCGTYRYWKGRKCVYDPLVELLPIAQVMKFELALAATSIKDPESGNGIPDILKSFLQFNDPWPANSWELTEPSLSYQSYYVRLFAAFTL